MAEDIARTRAFYDGWADAYAGFGESPLREHYEWPAVESLLPDLPGKRVLDVVCGPGDSAGRLADRGADVLGVDLSREMVRVAYRRYGDRADLRDGLGFLADASFDVVTSRLTLGHVEDWDPVLAAFHRLLTPGGTLVLSLSHPFSDYLMLRDDGFPAFGGLFGEDDGPRLTAERDPPRYAAVERFRGEWGTGDNATGVPFYRRPLSAVFGPLFANGFAVTGVEEPTPSAELEDRSPDLAARLRRRPPAFLCLGAEKR